ncbi:hypothetical protein PTTG_27594 [Puccinia triticina 1-1 BBBD Race 1]|uniref:Peptidase A2 domain-containing protein n=1 Tax=Puccinia triticina (isolate 1-1 / race 1 (BBBD)) TaxID=630390 RepID=A0A180GJD0_PUCT1|nr:hypothetical protein PTTG_27594 [Puccinia triticina 1-1 BBBD Race 1]
MDSRLFASLTFFTLHNPQATTPLSATFLIDSGATHNVLSGAFAARAGLRLTDSAAVRTISGFDGSRSQASQEVDLLLDQDQRPSTFIITTLKDSYDGILGMPWIKQHGHWIKWNNHRLTPISTGIATAKAVSSTPKTTSQDGEEPVARQARRIVEGVPTTTPHHQEPAEPTGVEVPEGPPSRETPKRTIATAPAVSSIPKSTTTDGQEPVGRYARLNDEGVRALCGTTPPQCESPTIPPLPPYPTDLRTTGKRVHLLNSTEQVPGSICAAKASWSTSARLAAETKGAEPAKALEDMVPARYHSYLGMFRKTEAQRLPPRRKYDFRVDLVPGAVPQASQVIPLSPAENC